MKGDQSRDDLSQSKRKTYPTSRKKILLVDWKNRLKFNISTKI